MEQAEFKCAVCGAMKPYERDFRFPDFKPSLCGECEEQAEKFLRRERIRIRISRTLPYTSWDTGLGIQSTLSKVMGAAAALGSLYVMGDTGVGKTRALCQAATKKMWAGISLQWRNCCEWGDRLSALAGESMLSLEREKAVAVSADILVLDDMGKGKHTERVAATYFDVVDRAIREGTLLWITSNKTFQQLEAVFGDEYGAPLVRRVAEVSTVVEVP